MKLSQKLLPALIVTTIFSIVPAHAADKAAKANAEKVNCLFFCSFICSLTPLLQFRSFFFEF